MGKGKVELNSHVRYRLTDDEEALLMKYRTQKSKLEDECNAAGIDPKEVKHYWYKGEHYSINVKGAENETFNYHEFKQDFIDTVEKIRPNHIKIERDELIEDSHCLLIDPSDLHVNKLCSAFETGEEYNSSIAVQRAKDGVAGIIKKSKGFNIDKIILIVGNLYFKTNFVLLNSILFSSCKTKYKYLL